MLLALLALGVVGFVVFKVLSGDERQRLREKALALVKQLRHAARWREEEQVFHDTLKQRTRWPIVTTALILVNVGVFIAMALGDGALSNPETAIAWGGNLGTKTTNGEWWRLLTSLVVHTSLLQLLLVVAALAQAGRLLERLMGPAAFAATYFLTGLVGNLANLSLHRAVPGFGAAGAVFGVYGAILAFIAWSGFHRSVLEVPSIALKRLLPLAAVFTLYFAFDGSLDFAAEVAAAAAGLKCGATMLIGFKDPRPGSRRVAFVCGAGVVVALMAAIPMRGIADVWPELTRIVEAEDRIASFYQRADQKFRKRAMTADALADLIDHTIVPELKASELRLKSISKIPQEHQPLVTDAERYLQMRSEGWRLQAEGLRKIELRALVAKESEDVPAAWRRKAEAQHRANLATLGNAEGKAKASLVVLEQIRAELADPSRQFTRQRT